jgi:ubiquinone/menaquinone biosynthesis C-methylase UbiE
MSTKTETIEQPKRHFLPAAGHDLFLPLYDPFTALLGGNRVRKRLVDQADLQPGQKILDIGSGTGTLSIAIKRDHPSVNIVGIDPDPKALTRARKKAQHAGVSIQFDQGFSDQLPYPDASFDRVFSTLMFHHLKDQDKEKTLQEVGRVLKTGGSFHLLDFVRSKNNSEEQILKLLNLTGFKQVRITERGSLIFLPVSYFRASA